MNQQRKDGLFSYRVLPCLFRNFRKFPCGHLEGSEARRPPYAPEVDPLEAPPLS